jgi:hypothetical protein
MIALGLASLLVGLERIRIWSLLPLPFLQAILLFKFDLRGHAERFCDGGAERARADLNKGGASHRSDDHWHHRFFIDIGEILCG